MGTDDAQATFLRRLDQHKGILFTVAGAYCRNPAEREDFVQEMVAQLWRSYPRYDEKRTFSTWMYRVALNTAISFGRRRERHERRAVATEPAAFETVAAPASDEPDDRLERLRGLIDELDDLNRALMLLYLEGNSHAAIAAVLGLSETNVATKVARIKQRLKREVSDVRSA
jgi:RNA polymerase sigma-70 factor (ECF subfamily)